MHVCGQVSACMSCVHVRACKCMYVHVSEYVYLGSRQVHICGHVSECMCMFLHVCACMCMYVHVSEYV